MRISLLLLLLVSPLWGSEPSRKPRAAALGTTALLAKAEALGVIFAPDGESVGLIEAGSVRYWKLRGGDPASERTIDLSGLKQRISVSGDGRTIFATTVMGDEQYRLACIEPGVEKPRRIAIEGRPDTLFIAESGRYAAVEAGGGVRILQTTDGATVTEFARIEGLRRFSATIDGKSFAFCNRDGDVFVRSAGGPAWSPSHLPKHRFAAVALSGDGTKLAAATYLDDVESGRKFAGPVQVWSMTDQKLIITCDTVEWFAEFPNRLRFTPDDATLLAGDGAYIRGWNVATGKVTFAIEPGWNYPGPLVVSPDSRHIAVAYPKRAMVWELATGKAPRGFEGHSGAVWDISFSPDGKRAATSSYGLTQVAVWDTATSRIIFEANSPFGRPPTGTTPPTARKRDGQTEMKSTALVPGRVRVLFSPDGRKLATVNEATGCAGPIRMWDVQSGRKLWELPLTEAFAPDVAFTKAGLLVAQFPRAIHYDLETGQPTWTCGEAVQAVSVKVNRRGTLAVIEEKNGLKNPVIDATSGKVLQYVEGIPHAFTSDGRGLVAIKVGPTMTNGFFNDFIAMNSFDGKAAREVGKVPMGTALGRISPDGEYRVIVETTNHLEPSANRAFTFREVAGDRAVSAVMRIDNKNDERRFAAFGGLIEHRPAAHAFSPDNRLFAAAYENGLLAVWDTGTGDILFTVESNCLAPKFLAFAPDGRTVFTASGEGAGGPVFGFDTTGRDDPKAISSLGGSPLAARRAIYELAARPGFAVATARAIFAETTEMDRRQHEAWIINLAAPSFALREAASNGLAGAGWRVEAKLKAALASATSEEARQRITDLLCRRDARHLRAIHLLEVVGNDDAKKLLEKLAAITPETFTAREARRVLARIAAP